MSKVYDQETLDKIQKVELDMLRDFDAMCEKHGIQYFAVGGTTIGCVRHKGFIPWDDDIDIGMVREDFEKFLRVANTEYGDKYSVLNFESDNTYPLMTTRWVKNGTVFLEESFKHLKCNFGIFLDLYCFDNVSDDDKKMKKQCFWAWFWGKWMILRSVNDPVLYQTGFKAKFIRFCVKIGNFFLRLFHVSPKFFYKKAMKHVLKYKDVDTKRVAYMFDPNPGMSIMAKEDVLPTVKIPYEDTVIGSQKNVEKYIRFRFGDDFMTLPPEEKRHNHVPYKLDFGDEK